MNEEQFIQTYIATFLASYMAQRYERDCAAGHPGEPYNHQPIEDARHLAKCAWKQLQEIGE